MPKTAKTRKAVSPDAKLCCGMRGHDNTGELVDCPDPVTRFWTLNLANHSTAVFGTCEYHKDSFGFHVFIATRELARPQKACAESGCEQPATRAINVELGTRVRFQYVACIHHENDFGFSVRVHVDDVVPKETTV